MTTPTALTVPAHLVVELSDPFDLVTWKREWRVAAQDGRHPVLGVVSSEALKEYAKRSPLGYDRLSFKGCRLVTMEEISESGGVEGLLCNTCLDAPDVQCPACWPE